MTKRDDGIAGVPVIDALERLIAGESGATALPSLEAFASDPPRMRQRDEKVLGRYARRRLVALSELLAAPNNVVRHAAACLMGYSRDRRAPAAVFSLLCHQKDFYDHDYGYLAIARLGPLSLGVLRRAALHGSRNEAWHAVQALGHAGRSALGVLHEVLARRRPLPRDFFTPYSNLHDPRGLPDVLQGLEASDPRTRKDALEAADALLETARERSKRLPVDVARFADAVVSCRRKSDPDVESLVVSCVGWLRDARHLDLVLGVTESKKDSAFHAIQALARFPGGVSRPHLQALLDCGGLANATTAAAALLRQRGADRATRARAASVALGGLERLPGDEAWCEAADLLRNQAGLRRLLLARAAEIGPRRRRRLLGALEYGLPWQGPKRRLRVRTLMAQCPAALRPELKCVLGVQER